MKRTELFRKLFSGLLIVTLVLPLLFGCTPAPEAPGTDSSAGSSVQESFSGDGADSSSDLPEDSDSDDGEAPSDTTGSSTSSSGNAGGSGTSDAGAEYSAEKKILNKSMGIRGAKAESSNGQVATAKVYGDSVVVSSHRGGTAVITVTDYFGFTAKINVSVNAEKKTLTCDVVKCTQDFIEVGLDYGAKGDNSTDDTKAFQNALDAAKPGQTVYVYPGRYKVSLLSMREGVTLKMYTTMTDASQGFTGQVAEDFNKNKIAVLSGTRILNCNNKTPGRNGSSNFKIIGGGIDLNLAARSCLIFGMAKNVTIENVIFKDIQNEHVIQLTGSTDSVVKNCIFAGFLCGANFTREVIQVEPSTSAATGNPGPVTFGVGEFALPKNITITDCYFGKSDEAGAPLIAIGHHSQVGGANVTGFKITNNIFDECLYAAIRYNNLVDVEITGNLFRSTSAYKNPTQYSEAVDPAFIHFYHYNKASTYTADNRTVTRAAAEEQAGLHKIRIENNTFEIAQGSDKRILSHVTNNTYAPGAAYVNHYRQDTYQGEIYTLAGYRETRNYASDISFSNNVIRFTGKPAYSDWYLRFGKVYGLKVQGNRVEKASGVSFSSGEKYYNFGANEERTHMVLTKSSDRTVTVTCAGKSWVITPKYYGIFHLVSTEGGVLQSVTADKAGNVTLTFEPKSGYSFQNMTSPSGTVPATGNLSSPVTYTLTFQK